MLTSVLASSPVMAGGPITVTDITKNQGGAPVGESTTAFYLSINGVYEAGDQFLGNRTVGALAASETSSGADTARRSGTAAGTVYQIIGVADANGAISESLEATTRVSAPLYRRTRPDRSALSGPSSAAAGTSISVTVTTKNQGGDTAPVSLTRFYLSSNNSLDASDQLLGAREVSSLAPGLSEAGPALLPIRLDRGGNLLHHRQGRW